MLIINEEERKELLKQANVMSEEEKAAFIDAMEYCLDTNPAGLTEQEVKLYRVLCDE